MKISFDFDSTLSRKDVQEYCKCLIQDGHDIWITTSRVKEFNGAIHDHTDLILVAQTLDIPENKIHFTNAEFKASYLQLNNFDIHIDDDRFELERIAKTDVLDVDVCKDDWKSVICKHIYYNRN